MLLNWASSLEFTEQNGTDLPKTLVSTISFTCVWDLKDYCKNSDPVFPIMGR